MGVLQNFIRRPRVAIFLVLLAFSIFMNVVLGIAPPGDGTGQGG